MLVTIVVFFLILSVLILVHELGHYLVARKLNVKVEEFGFGMPYTPPLFSRTIGETKYSFYPILIGGFVKLFGEDEVGSGKVSTVTFSQYGKGGGPVSYSAEKKRKGQKYNTERAFFSRPVWQRAIIVFAGVVMNFLLAVAIISYLFAFQGVQEPGNNVEIVGLAQHAPAAEAGLKVGDTILSVDGEKVTTPDSVISYTKAHLGQQIHLVVKTTKGKTETILVTPRVHYPADQGAMGITISPNTITKKYPWYQAPFVGLKESVQDSWMILQGMWQAISQAAEKRQVPAGLAGPVGIAQLTGQFIQIGPAAVLSLVSLLSLNLAIFNVLPIPALDGGRLFFILIEGITRRKVNPRFEVYTNAVGMALLLALIGFITFHDIMRLVTHQPLLPQ